MLGETEFQFSLNRGASKQQIPTRISLTAPTLAHWIALVLLAVSGSASLAPSAAKAASILFGVEGTFEGGGTFSGSFLFDPLQPPPGSPTAFVDAFSITSTPGVVFPGFSYSGNSSSSSAQLAPIGVIQFSFANVDQGSLVSQLVISVPGDSFADFGGGPIVNSGSVISFEQDWSSTENRYRAVAGGQVTVVPEPSTFALAGLGAAALMILRRRK